MARTPTSASSKTTEDGKAAINIQFFANARMRLRPILNKHRLRLGDTVVVTPDAIDAIEPVLLYKTIERPPSEQIR